MKSPGNQLSPEDWESIDRQAARFERELESARKPLLEDFLVSEPALRPYLLEALLNVEIRFRRSQGERVESGDFFRRFPADQPIVEQAFHGTAETTSTATRLPPVSVARGRPDTDPEKLGRYLIRKRLGKGGFGVVYLAHDPKLDRNVAVKVPRRDRFRSSAQVASFIQEARLAAKLKHPGLVVVHDVQEEDGLPFIVQEYIDGDNLARWAARQQPTIQQIVRVLVGVSNALSYAHQQRLTHCDLKLANVLIDKQGQPHVADFGLAVHESLQSGRKGQRFGTPHAMAPEQVRGEGHRLDDRTDIWAIGIMLYELLVKRRPFPATEEEELFDQILNLDPEPPRQVDRSVSRELERICLKCLSKRKSDRYHTADDLVEDLAAWLSQKDLTQVDIPKSSTTSASGLASQVVASNVNSDSSVGSVLPAKIIPKGLRSFDADDADFFLDLLPGPRDRDGLPESIRFWKNRIQKTDPDQTFSVGLIYGPSGCGKSSLIKAGVLPRLDDQIVPIYMEATGSDTEAHLLKQLRKHFPHLAPNISLVDACVQIRLAGDQRRRKVLLVIDQFEQWLHSHPLLGQAELVDALRQCEGKSLQAILLVRDDFFAGVHRLFQQLDDPLVEGHNYALIDKFDIDHARQVMIAFGRAYGRLSDQLRADEKQFVEQAVQELAINSKVIGVRLSLFADMMKGRTWTPSSLKEVGGVGGVGETFLEETFSSSSAPPAHRVHEKAIRQVLRAMLPDEANSEIKGSERSEATLRDAAGYQDQPKRFAEVIRILDQELRIITPSESDADAMETERGDGSKLFQLTHDYLVPSLRAWLTRKQRETRKGRAELKLAERSALWNARPEKRYLPSAVEWATLRLLTAPGSWSPPERLMMRKAARVHVSLWGGSAVVLLIALFAVWRYDSTRELQRLAELEETIRSIETSDGAAIPVLLESLDKHRKSLVIAKLEPRFSMATGRRKLKLSYALARCGQIELDTVVEGIIAAETQGGEVDNLVAALSNGRERALPMLRSAAAFASDEQRWATKTRLAVVALHLGDTSIAAEMLRIGPEQSAEARQLVYPLDRARAELSAVEQLTPDARERPAKLRERASLLYYLDRTRESLSIWDRLVSDALLEPNSDDWRFRALCAARLGNEEKALESIERLRQVAYNPVYASTGNIIAQAWLGNFATARKQLDELAEAQTESPSGLYDSASTAAQLIRTLDRPDSAEADHLTQLAVELLRRAFAGRSNRDLGSFEKGFKFAPLHGRPAFEQLVRELIPTTQPWDPVQRSEFITEFRSWHGDLEDLARLLGTTDIPALRSGMALAVGSLGELVPSAQEAWQSVFSLWTSDSKDSGTHSAAAWAAGTLKISLPQLTPSSRPPPERDWWYTQHELTLIRIPAGAVARDGLSAISISHPFWISDREISIRLFGQFIRADATAAQLMKWQGAYRFPGEFDDSHPVQQVGWNDAVRFCNWLSEQHGLTPFYQIESLRTEGREASIQVKTLGTDGFRLPTADEWEYACRAMTTTSFSCGDTPAHLRQYAVFGASSTAPCGSKLCQGWGLFNMHGNVEEWCWDPDGQRRMVRGGSWSTPAEKCRSSSFAAAPATSRRSGLGFRVAQGISAKRLEE